MSKLYFITGSQDLYGEEILAQVAKNSKTIASYLNDNLGKNINVEWLPVVKDADDAEMMLLQAVTDRECVGIITWMHTFSPAKMWIRGLKMLNKPMLHLHTQFNRKIPYNTIDMNFMNLNQSAHGDREFGFICARLRLKREVVVGYYKDQSVLRQIKQFVEVASALEFSRRMKVVMFGSNMREVAVTDGDRVESQIQYGWSVNYYGIGDLEKQIKQVSWQEIDLKTAEYLSKYELNTNDLNSVKEQAGYEVAIEKFLKEQGAAAFTDTFQDLYGLNQLPGLAVQNIMAKGIGFAPEGDYKTSALMAVMCKMAQDRQGATAFIENYTYDLTEGSEMELASHMLEVSPVLAFNKPTIEVHKLGIGNKNPPARLVFDGIEGAAIAVSMVDMGDKFRLICAKIKLIKPPHPMPKLPVARVMWTLEPDFKTGAAAWIYAGGAHHSVISTAITVDDIKLFAKLTDTELIIIDENTKL